MLSFLMIGALPLIVLKPGLNRIGQSCKIKPGQYVGSWIEVGASNITIECSGVTLASSREAGQGKQLESVQGIGIRIEGRNNVTIKNAKVHGFQHNLSALKCSKLRVEGGDFSFSRADKLADKKWLELRSLAKWRSYGSGIWVEQCTEAVVVRTTSSGAQNGILVVDSNGCLIKQNDTSYNSGWGIGLWAASKNTVIWNHADFVNRPWADGWGGDSAGLVMVNGSDKNFIVGNSLTHGGDGFFLTDLVNGGYDATSKTFNIRGACNDNTVAYNDGSWSPHNAFEGTFSLRNSYFRNQAEHSDYGFWLGFSSESHLQYNKINHNQTDGIAIEYGRGNWIMNNDLHGNARIAVHVYAGDPEIRKTHPSTLNLVGTNSIRDCRLAYSFEGSERYWIEANQLKNAPVPENLKPEPRHSGEFEGRDWLRERFDRGVELYSERPAGWTYYREQGRPCGLDQIKAGEFAPLRVLHKPGSIPK